jgi:hypothetical protein
MQCAFEDACVAGYADMVASMTNDKKDRHVLAAAVRAGAHAILTENVKHFPAKSVEPYDIDVLTPDQFLAHQFHLNPDLLEEKLRGQAAARGIPYARLVCRLAKWAPSLPPLLLPASKSDSAMLARDCSILLAGGSSSPQTRVPIGASDSRRCSGTSTRTC